MLLLYAVAILSERFFETPSDVLDIVAELNLLLEECPDCPEKVSAYILLTDYYHYNFKIEAAWKRIFLATSIGYALASKVFEGMDNVDVSGRASLLCSWSSHLH